MVMALPATCDSAVSPYSHGCPAFLHRHFPPRSPPSHPLDLSLHSQQQPSPRDCFTIPKLQLPATASSGVCMAVARTVWFSFHLGCHRSALSLSALNVSPLTQLPNVGIRPCFSSPTIEGRSSHTNTPVFPPCTSVLLSFACVVLYILLRWSGTPVHSQLVLCTHYCVWGCIPDISMERDVLHTHLLLRHLVL